MYVQNQDPSCKQYKKWDRMGTVVEVGHYDQYLVRMEGTGRPTVRNRRFLRRVKVRPKLPTQIIPRPFVMNEPPQITVEPTPSKPSDPEPTSASEIDKEQESTRAPQSPTVEPHDAPMGIDAPSSTPTESPRPLRRSSRVRKAVTFYDPSTGTYAEPSG